MRSLRILPALLFLLLLGGCVFPSGDELLAAPKPSSNYQSLQTELEKQLAQGVSYASPSEVKTVRLFSLPIWTTTA